MAPVRSVSRPVASAGGGGGGEGKGGGGEGGAGGASPAALAAVVAGGPSVQRLRQDRAPSGNAGDAELVAALLHQELPAAGRGRRHEDAIGLVLDALVAPVDPDEPVDLVVVRGDFLISDGPIVSEPVVAPRLEVARTEPQGKPPPVVGSSP